MNICTSAADTPTVALGRPDLLRALAALVPGDCIYTGHELAAIEFVKKGVRLRFSNRETFECDAVVGADGIHSRIRTGLLGASQPSYRGYAIFRGLAGTHAALTPGHNGESWGAGRRFGILGIGKDKVCWYATVNTSDLTAFAEDRKEKLQQLFHGWHHPIPGLIAATEPDAILLNGAYDLRISHSWSRRPVTLLGDAAHALTPNLGQGACMAIEDAFVLAQCLRDCGGVGEAFRRYESLRFRHVRNTILRSRWIGRVGQWEARAAVAVRDAVTRLLPPRMFECHSSLEERLAALCGTKQLAISS
jgi:2-polyprenyl-6-methoxyphenol hydroxylase-like FAD-dependent oxidoreductase